MKLKIKLKLKTLFIILCFSMLFQLLGTSFVIANAATTTPAKVSYTINGEAKIGNTIDIAVNISNITNFYGGSVDFSYDTSLLEVQSITKGDIFGTNKVSEPVKSVSNGLASIGLTLTGTNAGVSTNGTLAIIKAKVLKEGIINIKTTPLNVLISPIAFNSRVKLSDNNGNFITYAAEDTVLNLFGTTPIVNSFIADKNSSQPAGTPITFTGSTSGTTGMLYRFQIFDGSSWTVAQNYSSNNKFVWTPTKPSTYRIALNVKFTGAADTDFIYKTIDNFIITQPTKPIINSFISDKTSSQPTCTPITFTCSTFGPTGMLYRFQVFDGSTWAIVQNYSTNNKLIWTPNKPGTYRIAINVKLTGAPDTDFIYKSIDNFIVTQPTKPIINSFTSDKNSSQQTGTPITFTGSTFGPTGMLYRFQIFDGSTWSVVQNYSNNNKLIWTPTKPGTYRIALNVKLTGASDTDFIYKSIDNFIVTQSTKPIINSFISDKISSQQIGTPITFTGSTSGPTGMLYRFQVSDGLTWTVVQNYSTNNKLIWTPTKPGTYRIALNVKLTGAADTDFIYKSIDNFIVTQPTKPIINSFTSDKNSSQQTGTPITFTGSTFGPTGMLYRFQVFDGSTWSVVQNYSNNNKLIWTPTKPATYRIAFNVKLDGASDTDFIYKSIDNFVVTQ
ncbi:hypothetical protein KPL40_16840 [Clostridium gasigenes]|uniref:cohesin domain-containing protein n=1 Tax=Clostridium gasigenes TaxID=94869 RepID=UPI001C0B9A1C|nr:cohesin domain-containing protein [Clostridium gasigenes]MBU3134096.1 hypothetical protein [Clostridium gasigenes]